MTETIIERKVKFRRENWYGTGILTKKYIHKLIHFSLVWHSECTMNHHYKYERRDVDKLMLHQRKVGEYQI